MKSWIDPYKGVLACLFVALVSVGIFFVAVETPDSARFKSQADALLQGEGYTFDGKLETFLPPGYPVFLSVLQYLGGGNQTIRIVHAAMFAAGCVLLFYTFKPLSIRLAVLAGVALAVHPLASRMVGFILSESFGLFLAALQIFTFSRIQGGSAKLGVYFLFGALCVAIPLTSPALVILCVVLFCWVATCSILERETLPVVASALGVIVFLLPWQLHCQTATGKICPFLYTNSHIAVAAQSETGWPFFYWYRTWSLGQRDIQVLFDEDPLRAPGRAFNSAKDRAKVLDAYAGLGQKNGKEMLVELAKQEEARNPIRQKLWLPFVRSVNLWFDMPQFGHVQMEYVVFVEPDAVWRIFETGKVSTTALRAGKALVSTATYLLYIAYPIFLLAAFAYAVMKRNVLVLLICASILGYTIISAIPAVGEARRNVVFLPAIIYLLGFLPVDGPPDSGGAVARRKCRRLRAVHKRPLLTIVKVVRRRVAASCTNRHALEVFLGW